MSKSNLSNSRNSRRILIIGADGMRPDSITESRMPTYSRLMKEGALIKQFSAVYPSETRVSMSTFTTGVYPGKHGIVSNKPYVSSFPGGWLQTGDPHHLRTLPDSVGKPTLLRPTLGDRLLKHGLHVSVASSGSGGSALLWNLHHPEKVINVTTDYETAEMEEIRKIIGPVPEKEEEKEQWVIDGFLKTQLPDLQNQVMILWIAQPDSACHKYGLGAPEHHRALERADRYLEEVLEHLEKRGEEIDLLLLSDHGHSTIDPLGTSFEDFVDLACEELGINAEAFAVSGRMIYKKSEVFEDSLAKLVTWFKKKSWCGSVYLHHKNAEAMGALPMEILYGEIEHDRAPVLVVNPTWTFSANNNGVLGVTQLPVKSGLSTHGNANPTDLSAFCLAWGPGFKKSVVSSAPSGLVDIAPTICHLLHLPDESGFDGRVLHEILTNGKGSPEYVVKTEGTGTQKQPIRIAQAGGSRYILGVDRT